MDNGFSAWGGYMEAKITKLEEQFTAASEPFRKTNLFQGISIYVNGLTTPSADELKRIMMVNGGVYHHYVRKNTTYIIASCLPDVKVRNMDTTKLISAQWVLDCLKEQKILDYSKYLLYTNHKPSQPKIFFQKKAEHDIENPDVAKVLTDLAILNAKMKMDPLTIENNKPNIKCEELKLQLTNEANNLNITNANNKIPARTAVDPKFLSDFYNNSRLHHIATLGAGFKQYVSELREKNIEETFPAREILKENFPKRKNFKNVSETIMHIDMDCFFVSVGLRKHKYLIGQPIAVTHSKGGSETVERPGVDRQLEMDLYMKRLETKLHDNIKSNKIKNGFDGKESLSEIASCSYEAREMGVRNGMFVGQALKLCPQLKTIPYDFEGYKEVAFTLYNTIAQYTLNIEAVSCDEMFVNLTELLNDIQLEPMEFVSFVREQIKTETDCPCSAGVGSNRLQARMATKKAKPNGQFYLNSDSVIDYMSNILISDLPGVGQSTTYTLKQQNWLTCSDLQTVSLVKLQKKLGKKFGETLYQFCRGIDNRPLVYGQVRKSVSAEVNYGIRFKEFSELEKFLRQLTTEVHTRLKDIKRKGKCITLKVMIRSKDAPLEASKFMGHGYCDHLSKSVSLTDYTDNLEKIFITVMTTMRALSIPPDQLRGLGIQISKLDDPSEGKDKKENVIKDMFAKVVEKQKPKIYNNPLEIPETTANLSKVQVSSPKTTATASPNNKSGKDGDYQSNKSKIISKKINVMHMLQNAPKIRKRTVQDNLNNYENIDMDVLAELPEDIQSEILEEQRKQAKISKSISPFKKSSPKKSTKKIEVDVEFLTALPLELRLEVEKEILAQKEKFSILNKSEDKIVELSGNEDLIEISETVKETISNENIFLMDEAPELIENWVQSADSPEEFDVQILSQHFQEFVRARNIHILYVPAIRFHRIVNRQSSCSWHLAYKSVISNLQEEMILNYGAKMLLDEELNCDKC